MIRALRVLMVEESATDAILVAHALGEGGRAVSYERVEDEAAFRTALAQGGWDLLISAWALPRLSASRALVLMDDAGLDLPYVILCDAMATAIEAMRAGAREVLVRDNLERLGLAVERELRALALRTVDRRLDTDRAARQASLGAADGHEPASLAARLRRTFTSIAMLVSTAVVVTAVALAFSRMVLAPQLEQARLASTGAAETRAALLEQDASLRGYLLTRDARFLDGHHRAEIAYANASTALDVPATAVAPYALARARAAEEVWQDRWARAAASTSPDGIPPSLHDGARLFDVLRAEETTLARAIAQRTEELLTRDRQVSAVQLGTMLAVFTVLLFALFRQYGIMRDAVIAPVAALLHGMGRVRAGELMAAIEPSGPSELRLLAGGLNDMMRALGAARGIAQARDEIVREHANRLRQILDASREFSESLNLAYVVRSVRTSTMAVAGCDDVVVWLMADDQKGLREAASMLADGSGRESIEPSGPWRAAKSGRSTFEGPDGRVRSGDAGALPVRAIVIPLIVGARVVGALEARYTDARMLSREAVEVLEMLAAHAATAIESARLNQITERTSEMDPLTQLYNRRRLDADLEAECKRSARYGRPLSFVMLDVDHFKAFNDTHGHPQADVVLQQVAEVIAAAARSTDTAYRYGGEEFCVLLRETPGESAVVFAERLRQRIELRFTAGALVGITASFGVGELGSDIASPRELIEAADGAMYESKRTGRNRVVRSSRPAIRTSDSSGALGSPSSVRPSGPVTVAPAALRRS